MNAIPKLPKQGRIKEKYNSEPTAREKAYHLWLMDNFPCGCGCEGPSTVVHHPLQRHPNQRWRRDHEYVVPMNGYCHFALHKAGSENKFQAGSDYALMAHGFRKIGYEVGKL